MRLRVIGVLLLLFGFPLVVAAQSSVVFLTPGYSRPPATNKPLSIPQSIQAVSTPSPWDFSNINITSFLARDENEPSIAINPTDPNNFIIGANDYMSDSSLFCFVTIDGGLHWRGYPMQKNNTYAASAFNPAIAFNANGKAFYTFGRAQLSHLGNPYAINDVACFTNANKGDSASWTMPVRIHFDSLNSLSANTFADKFYTAVDRSQNSPYVGRVYTAWVEYIIGEKNHIVISRSLDEGKTWSKPLSITDTANYQCPIPAIGPNGELYISFLDLDTNHLNIHCTKSLDGGITFSSSANKVISPYKNVGSIDSTGAYAHPVLKGHVRASSFPSIAVDHSTLHQGRIYVTWAGKGNDNRLHIFLSFSDDKAQTWSTPKTIENDPNPTATDKFLPWIAVDNTNGDVGVVYYDSRNDPTNNILVDAYLSFSHDGASTFTPLRISSASFDPRANSSLDSTFIGDYLGLDADNKHWYPVWSDTRVGYDQDLYLGIVRPYAPSAPKEFTVIEDPVTHFAKLSWKHDAVTTIGEPLGKYTFKFWREDHILDQTLQSPERNKIDDLATQTTSHTYFIQVIADNGDTSTTASAKYYPHAFTEPLPPVLLSAEAQSGGFQAEIKMPATSVSGAPIIGLDKWYKIVDNGTPESIPASAPGEVIHPFFGLDNGFHKIQLAASTKLDNDDTVLSVVTPPVWLYAGSPLTSYAEDFTFGKNIFSLYSWNICDLSGKFYINDSLPTTPYQANEDSWFALPSVHISDDTKTLEFDHIASVAAGDSAMIEFSTDDGVHYEQVSFFEMSQHPDNWKALASASTPIHHALGFTSFIGKDLIARFHLITHSSNADGWFIGDIKYTNFLSVKPGHENSISKIAIAKNPLHSTEELSIGISTSKNTIVSAALYDVLGHKRFDATSHTSSDNLSLKIKTPEESGAYLLRIHIDSERGSEEYTEKVIVLP